MSEQNILNPNAQSQLNPTYTIPHKDPETMSSWQPRSGVPFSRYMMARGMEFDLHWDAVPFSTYLALRQWMRQYERGFFSYFDIDDNRYYSGQFLAEPQFERKANNQVNITATFVVLPKVPLFQYPSNWGIDSVFLDERDDFGNDQVKLTGTWDRRDKNYALQSEHAENAVWVEVNSTVTADAATDPNGTNTADKLTRTATNTTEASLQQTSIVAGVGAPLCYSIYGKAGSAGAFLYLRMIYVDSALPSGIVVFNLSTGAIAFTGSTYTGKASMVSVGNGWWRCSITANAISAPPANRIDVGTTNNSIGGIGGTAADFIFIWGAQFEYGSAPTPYTAVTASAVALIAPAANANYHGGFSYFNAGTVITDAAEWRYFGFGFRVWAYKGPDMGIMQISIDGVVLGTVDLFAAAPTVAAVVFTSQNQFLGDHRVKLSPTDTKNAGSSAFIVAADAVEVMR
jgi:hypothetical protein